MKQNKVALAFAAGMLLLGTQPTFALQYADNAKAASITAKDIDRAAAALRRAVCALHNNGSFLRKAKYVKAVNDQRNRISDMKKALEAEGRLDELARLDSAMSNAETTADCIS